NKAGWSKTQLTAQQKTALCAANGFTTANGLTEVFADKASTATIKFDTAQDTFYLYTRDMLGNMVEQQLSTAPVYNISVPTWIGLVAVHGKTDRLITPTDGCYIVNNSSVPVKATITSFAPANGATNKITLLNTATPAKNEMNLTIMEKDSKLGFGATSVSAISDVSPLELGVMPATSTTLSHGVGFTFTAQYNADIDLKLTDWDLFTMSYKFEIQP
ncbi:MAG: hypothetical protein RR829_04455, partial [Oscillospiraceae bacterium]